MQRSPSHWTIARLLQNAHDLRDSRTARPQRIIPLYASSSPSNSEIVASRCAGQPGTRTTRIQLKLNSRHGVDLRRRRTPPSPADPTAAHPYDLGSGAVTPGRHASDERIVELWLRDRPTNTRVAYERDYARFRAFIGARSLRTVGLGDLSDFAATLIGSPATRRRTLSAIKALLTTGFKMGIRMVRRRQTRSVRRAVPSSGGSKYSILYLSILTLWGRIARRAAQRMNTMTEILLAIFEDDQGASLVEYALIVALVAVVAIAGLSIHGQNSNSTLSTAANSIGG